MRILFVKTSSLGDVIHNCPAVTDVHRHFPGAVIDWVVEEKFAEIVSMHPAVRRVLPVAVRRWRGRLLHASTWREISAFRKAMREQSYDLIIDTQGLLKSALIVATALGSKHGFDSASARESIASRFYDVTHHIDRKLHAVERNRLLTAAALAMAADSECDYGLKPNGPNPLRILRPFRVLLSMTSRADKLWPEAHWVELVQSSAALGLECVLPWGSPGERARCDRIAAAAGAGLVPEALSLGELAGLMKASEAVVGVDTGLIHFAVALGVPAVGLYCATEPALTGLHGGSRTVNLGRPNCPPSAMEALTALATFA
jgi:heptosyltransferase-1